MMYSFKSLEGAYTTYITHREPGYTVSRYSGKTIVSARQRERHYEFTLENRIDVRLDGEPPSQIMDFLMMQLGNSLYPMTLHISGHGKICAVSNMDQVKKRWYQRATELLKEYRTIEFKTYLEIAGKNMAKEENLIRSLSKDSFIRYFFLAYGHEILEIDCFNFPRPGRKATCYARKVKAEQRYTLFPAFGEEDVSRLAGTLNYHTFPTGELQSMKAALYLSTIEGDVYRKGIALVADRNQHQVKTGLLF